MDPLEPMPRRPSEPGEVEQLAVGRAILYRRLMVGFIVLALIVVLASLVYTASVVRDSQRRILDCTAPAGACYQRGQAQTAGAVENINRVVILAAACSADLERGLGPDRRQEQIQNCVIERLAVDQP